MIFSNYLQFLLTLVKHIKTNYFNTLHKSRPIFTRAAISLTPYKIVPKFGKLLIESKDLRTYKLLMRRTGTPLSISRSASHRPSHRSSYRPSHRPRHLPTI